MKPAYVPDVMVAHLLGRKLTWLRKHRSTLEAEGFPHKDALIGQTNLADIEAWIAKRRRLADPVPAASREAADTTRARINYDRL